MSGTTTALSVVGAVAPVTRRVRAYFAPVNRVAGVPTIAAMREAHATCMAIEAGRTLIFDRERVIAAADAAGIAIVAASPQ